jgi:trimethylamine--corrinoid protein Co-methyltransferase
MPGLSSPVTVAGAMIQKYASFFAGLVLAQTVNPGNPFIFPIEIGGFDMRTGNVATASPEIAIAAIAGAQMARYYGLPSVTVIGTDSKMPDAQAGAEKAFQHVSAALAGVNLIHGCASGMDGMMVASMEQCVIDDDIMGMSRRLLCGLEVDDEHLAVEIISEVSVGKGNFLDHAHTIRHFRNAIFEPKVFTRERRQDWLDRGAPDARKVANARARRILAQHHPSLLTDKQVAEINHIANMYRSDTHAHSR